ncbi:MAG: hypothetical protein ABFC77_07050 [Thermoguttaceae bacterium]
MTAMNQCVVAAGAVPIPPASVAACPARPLHRLGEVRHQERIASRRVAQMLGVSIQEVERQEDPSADLRLSDLYGWEKALGVPAAELLRDPDGELSPPVRLRAQLLRVMKTVRSLQEEARQPRVRRLAEMLAEQILEIMPELKDTAAWPAIGHQRRRRDLGQAFYRRISSAFLDDWDGAES